MVKVTIEWLQAIPVFKEVPGEQLQWLIDNSENQFFGTGTFISKPGDAACHTYVVVEGRLRVYYALNGEEREIGVFEPGTISGYLPFSKGKFSNVFIQAATDLSVIALPVQNPPSLICKQYELTNALVGVMVDRVRTFTALQRKNEKVMALGKLSAGLAHELDPLATAVHTGSGTLKNHLRMMPETFRKFVQINLDPVILIELNKKIAEILNRDDQYRDGSYDYQKHRELLTDWLRRQSITCAPEVAKNLSDFGLTTADANEVRQLVPDKFITAAFNWINTTLITESMLRKIKDSSNQIAKLVGSVKNFTHMDRGHAKEYANIHDGICNTLTMLRHKIYKNGTTVVENFDCTLPEVKAMIGELNQVWTNLIDNALDAMECMKNGKLEIKTRREGDDVLIAFIDNGPGISENIMPKIFDPFFTTKQIGKGSGLGLDLVRRIVNQHYGSITVKSAPGQTEFSVRFPISA